MTLLLEALNQGWISLFAIFVLWIETAALAVMAPSRWRRFRSLLPNACSGTCLLTAVAVALRGDNVLWIMVLLGLSLIAHAADILMRGVDHAPLFRRKTE